MRWTREEYLDLMRFRDFPRPMFVELFGPLIGLEDEWRAQGATPEELDLSAFDWDYVERVGAGGNPAPFGRHQRQIIEETATYRLERDGFGRTLKLDKTTATIPLPLDFPVQDMDDWLRLKPLFEWRDDRVDPEAAKAAKAAQAQGKLVTFGIPGAYDMVRELMGEELGCVAYYEQPELIADIMATMTATATRVLKEVTRYAPLDQLSVHEDFAGKSGPLVGPAQIRETFRPYYRACWEIAQEAGAQIFQQDTDGNVNAVIDDLLDCGLTNIYPMEPAAGMDIVQLRRQYGQRLAFSGGIDKHVLRQGRDAIRRELEYKFSIKDEGGVVFGLDHRIPNGTPLADYRYYVDLGRELLGLPPRDAPGWARMAF